MKYKNMTTDDLYEKFAIAWQTPSANASRTRAAIRRELEKRGELVVARGYTLPPDTDIRARHAIGCVP